MSINAMHAKPDLRVLIVVRLPFRLGDRRRFIRLDLVCSQ